MQKEELRRLLNSEYSQENWEKIIEYVFPNVSILQNPQEIPHDNEKIDSFKNLGDIRLQDGKFLKLFEIHVADNVNIYRNKVELRNLVAKLIDQDDMHGVLAIYDQGKEDYRFTFTAKTTEFNMEQGDFESKETDHKRYTYILGKNESCRTAAERFSELAKNKENMTLENVQDAFSVEKLSKQFFTEYKERYMDFVQYFTGKRQVKRGNQWQEITVHEPNALLKSAFDGDETKVRDFVKLMLGRLVFLQFIQKKRWMGVPASDDGWTEGDTDFVHNAFKNFHLKNVFYSQFLQPLFYEALGNPNREGQLFHLTNTKVPYLDGGLFEKKAYESAIVDFPDELFERLFDFFDRYNFTIDENDPEEHEVGIDPEMLGVIFENLLEDNKDKGAFYTPKVIVQYMCQESLSEYLKTSLEERNLWPADNQKAEELETKIKNFVKKKEAGGIIDFDETMAKALRNVKICDPAIGSGAFPIGLLNEIFQCMYMLYENSPDTVGKIWEIENWQPNEIKKHIIQNSIYGVDIEPGAVDIARLRFWLSLIIDEPEPTALPNLDYKIMVGNSLLSKFEDEVIDINWELQDTSHGLFADEIAKEKGRLLKQISQKQKEIFEPESEKKKLKQEIRNLKIDLLINQLKLMIKTQGLDTPPVKNNFKNKSQFTKAQERYMQTEGWQRTIAKLEKLKENPNTPFHHFDWKLDFPEVMNELVTEKTGFDIVIGNPPYVRQERIGQEYKEILKKKFPQIANGIADLYVYFFGKGLEIQKKKGIFIYITLNKYLKTKYGLELRNFLASNYDVDKIIDFFELPVFQAATDTCITKIIATNNKIDTKYYPVESLHNLNLFKLTSDIYQKVIKNENEWSFLENNQGKIIEKIHKNAITLKEFTNDNIYYGVKTGANHIFIIDKGIYNEITANCKESKKYLHPYLEPKKFNKWIAEDPHKYIIGTFPSRKVNIDKAPGLKKYLIKFKDELEPKPKNHKGNWRGRKHGSYKWFETQDNVKYWKLFFEPKLIFIHTAKKHYFYQDNTGMVINNSCYFISSTSNFLFCFLNSKLFEWFKKIKFVAYGNAKENGRAKLDYNKMITVPIKKISNETEKVFSSYVKDIKARKIQGEDTTASEIQIENLIFRLYDLTYEEVKVIDPEFHLSKEEYEAINIEE